MAENKHKTKDFILLTEDKIFQNNDVKEVKLDQEMIGFVFYMSGEVSVDVTVNRKGNNYVKKTGYSSSFYYSPLDTRIIHEVSKTTPLKKVSLFIEPAKLHKIIEHDEKISNSQLKELLKPDAPFVEGTNFLLSPEMQAAAQKIMNCQYTGVTRDLLLESQAIELISHYLNQLTTKHTKEEKLINKDVEKLHCAKELLIKEIDSPPSLSELSKLSGLNTLKLKQGFKAIFGMPVYKYLQQERLKKSFELLEASDLSIQEIAYFIGYESVSSFSKAFYNKYGFRPSQVK